MDFLLIVSIHFQEISIINYNYIIICKIVHIMLHNLYYYYTNNYNYYVSLLNVYKYIIIIYNELLSQV